MGKLKDRNNSQLVKSRIRSPGFIQEQAQEYSDARSIPSMYLEPKKRRTLVQRVTVENNYYGQLAQRDQTFIDFSEVLAYNYATLLTGPMTIFTRTVPVAQAWYVDDLYFFATALGGITNSVFLGASALFPYFIFYVDFSGNNQLKLFTLQTINAGFSGQPQGSFPFLADRVGSRQAKFGITMFEGETITARVQLRGGLPAPPPAAINYFGFRFMGLETPKAYVEEQLRRTRWDQ